MQKVDVVNNAYITATNFTEEQGADHAACLARFAIDMMSAARETSLDGDDPDPREGIPLRVGIHCGPVLVVLVGEQAVKFTLMGEAASTAATPRGRRLPPSHQDGGA